MIAQSEERFQRTLKSSWQELDEEIVILSGQKLMGLNEAAGKIWQLADGSRTVREIAYELSVEFEASEDQILADACVFLESLCDRGLVERLNP